MTATYAWADHRLLARPDGSGALLFGAEQASLFSVDDETHRVLARWRELEEAGAQVYVPRGDQDYAVTFGLRTLLQRHLVTNENGLFRAVPGELPLLRYYANALPPIDHPGL